jgi:hypothetical protein
MTSCDTVLAGIDLDQKAIQNALSTPDYTVAKAVYDNGVYSKPAAVCTFDAARYRS